MAVSQNGWSANEPSAVSRRPVPGTSVGLTVRKGAAGDLLLEVAAAFDRDVQDIDNGRGALDDWGYAERPIRGSTATSNHASGTAIDLNATRWALGSPASVNLSLVQIAAVRRIVAATGGVVRWGGDYSGRLDPMHFEINNGRTEADCVRALARIRTASTPQEDDDMNQEQNARLERLERGMELIVQQLCGSAATIDNPWPGADGGGGWPTERYGVPAQERLSAVMFLQRIDRELNSVLNLDGRPGGVHDNQWGHLLSLRAEVRDGRLEKFEAEQAAKD